jgi:hypothetical protein
MHVFHRHVKMEPRVEQMVMDIVAHVEHSIRVSIAKHVNKYHCLFSYFIQQINSCEIIYSLKFY